MITHFHDLVLVNKSDGALALEAELPAQRKKRNA